MDPDELNAVLKGIPTLAATTETDDLLEQLQRAADEHKRILERQSDLIRRLRAELRDVKR